MCVGEVGPLGVVGVRLGLDFFGLCFLLPRVRKNIPGDKGDQRVQPHQQSHRREQDVWNVYLAANGRGGGGGE